MGRPVLIQTETMKQKGEYLTYADVSEMKAAIFWFGLAVTVAILIFVAKELWEWFKKKNDKSDEKLDYLVSAVTRLEHQMQSVQEEIVPRHDIISLVRNEIDWHSKAKRS